MASRMNDKYRVNMKKRLEAVMKMVGECHIVADIGTDHGYTAFCLLDRGICDKVIAADISTSALERARINCKPFAERISFRLCDGTEGIERGECDTAVIAGIGGVNIIDIIKRDDHKTGCFILQPMGHADRLRLFLDSGGYRIIDEDMVYENRRYYHIIKAVEGSREGLNETQAELGPRLIEAKHKVLCQYILREIDRYETIANGAASDASVLEEARARVSRYKEVLQSCYAL